MKSITAAAAILLAARQVFAGTTTSSSTTTTSIGVEEPSAAPTLGAQVVQGCFSSSGQLVFNSTQLYNSKSECALDICKAMGKPVAGTTEGQDCWCGDEYPPKSTLANDTDCNVGCTGYNLQACGGVNYWTIYNTGIKLAVENSPDSGSSSGTSSTTGPTAVVTASQSTVVVTASSIAESQSSSSSSSSSTNVAGIAAGVVVGVIAVGAITGGVFFFLRRRRNREIEEEHRRNAAVNAFINGSKPPGSSGGMSITDARLDPVMAQRRMSDGSIADNQDYSRRILRVTNA